MTQGLSIQKNATVRAKPLRFLHMVGTLWFGLSVAYLLTMALRMAGLRWWAIFSLSGPSAVLVFLLLSVYLFAVYRGISREEAIEVEHPLTSSPYYMAFYAVAPFMGAMAGLIGSLGINTLSQSLYKIGIGTFLVTCGVWVIVDPLLALIEAMLPAGRSRRLQRKGRQKAVLEERQRRRAELLENILLDEAEDRRLWDRVLAGKSEELARLLEIDDVGFKTAERKAAEIGVEAWHIGGLACMRYLHETTLAAFSRDRHSEPSADYIPYWWDGIGTWRGPSSS